MVKRFPFCLETSVERELSVYDIDFNGDMEKFVITLLVMRFLEW